MNFGNVSIKLCRLDMFLRMFNLFHFLQLIQHVDKPAGLWMLRVGYRLESRSHLAELFYPCCLEVV